MKFETAKFLGEGGEGVWREGGVRGNEEGIIGWHHGWTTRNLAWGEFLGTMKMFIGL